MPIEHELLRILNRDQALIARNLANQCLSPGGFARTGRTGDENVSSGSHGEAQEVLILLSLQQAPQFEIGGIE